MTKPETSGLKRIGNAFLFSIQGINTVCKSEVAFRQELAGCVILVPVAIWVGQSGLERALLVFVLLLILLVELINSAIEAVVNRFGGEQHALSGNAKDMGSAAVFLSIIIAAVVWGLVLFP